MFRLFLIIRQFFKKTFFYYIGKNDVLPLPLSKQQEYDLLIKMKEGDYKARAEARASGPALPRQRSITPYSPSCQSRSG